MAKDNSTKFTKARMRAVFPILVWVLLITWSAIFLFVLFWGVLQSLKDPVGFYMDPISFPKKEWGGWKFENYKVAFDSMRIYTNAHGWVKFPTMLVNSLIYCLVYSLVGLVAPMLTSYIYAKYHKRVPWTNIVWILVLINMYVPLSASLAASLNLSMTLGIYDRIELFWLSACGGFGGSFLIYFATWKGVNWEYAEAAFIDGASNWTVLWKVMFPMTRTVFLVLYLTSIISHWTDYQTPMVYLPSNPTLAYGVFDFQSSNESGAGSLPIKLASLIAVAIPMFTLFMIFKKKMMGSLTVGGLKG